MSYANMNSSNPAERSYQQLHPAELQQHHLLPRPLSYASYDHLHVPQPIPLPPNLAPLPRTPNFLPLPGNHIPAARSNLRRWGHFPSPHPSASRPVSSSALSFVSRGQRRKYSRGNIGSLQQLPQPHFVTQRAHWHESCRELGRSGSSNMCAFCKSNREPPEVYYSHNLKNSFGQVTCPILRKYRCRHCGATGSEAHTDSYCPRNPDRGLQSSMKCVLKTRVMSSGKVRQDTPFGDHK